MAITPINGISFGNRYEKVTKKNQEKENTQLTASKANKLVSIPVALWMALSPQISSAQDVLPSPKVDDIEITPAMQKDYSSGVKVVKENPYYLQEEYLRREEPFQVDGKNYTMYYMDLGANEFEDERVGGIYIVPEDFKLVRKNGMELNSPMNVIGLVFHRTSDARKDFVGAITVERTCNEDGTNEQKIIKEIKLAPEVGDELLDLRFGHSEYYLADPKSLSLEVVETPKLMEEKIAPTKVLQLEE